MKNKIIILTASLLILAFACEKSEDDAGEKKLTISKSTEKLIQSDNEFGIDLFRKVVASKSTDSNVFISPISASLALAMTYNGANGTTKESMETTLKKEEFETEEINQMYKELMQGLKSIDPKVTLNIANSIWYRNNFNVLQDFIQTNQDYYEAEVSSLNFSDPSALSTINNWVSEKTNEKIPEIINNISPSDVMCLINAIYFYGTWKYEFDKNDTEEKDFYLENGNTVKTDMMAQEATLNYVNNDLFSAVELPYGSEHYSMVVLLPEGQNKVSDVISQLSPENWKLWIESLNENDVMVNLPKFKFMFEDSLNNELIDMGMGNAFSAMADFTKINPNGGLFISMVKQKAYIDVNETGTEAAAVTVVEIELTSVEGGKKYFIVNKPFGFVIMEKESKSIIFIGKVAKPVYEE